jgi:hypothetical protein
VILHGFILQIIYTTVFRGKWFNNLTLPVRLLNRGIYCISRKTVDTEYPYYSWCITSTDIVKWRKTNDYENFEKGMIYMKILKKGGIVEKRGEEETKSMPHAPVFLSAISWLADIIGAGVPRKRPAMCRCLITTSEVEDN